MIRHLVNHLITWVIESWTVNLSDMNRAKSASVVFLDKIEKYISSNGLLWTIKRIKTSRLLVTRFLSGEPLKVIHQSGISSDKSGFPIWLKELKFLAISDNLDDKRLLITLLALSRSFKTSNKPDYSSITDPFKGSSQSLDLEILRKIIDDFNLKLSRTDSRDHYGKEFDKLEFFSITGKAGPAGHALGTAMYYVDKFSDRLRASLGVLATDKFVLWLDQCASRIPKKVREGFSPIKYQTIRRLALIQDPEAKVRVVAMADIISQSVLRGLHKDVFKLLKTKFSQDRTFTQDPKINKVEGHKFHSLDLTSATDRIPAVLQRDILSLITDENTAYSWYYLMVEEEYLLPGSKTETIKYSVGQPMGALSSWGMMALTHHIIVQYSAYNVGIYPFKDYILLGDDIVIANDIVAEEYRKVMEILGVDISEHKTHTSENYYEFAKRWFYKGTEVTGLPLTGFIDNYRNPVLMVSQIMDQIRKGNHPGLLGFQPYEILARLYYLDRKLPSRWRVSAINKAENFSTLLSLCHEFNYDKARSWMVKWLPEQASVPISPETLQRIVTDSGKVAISVLSEAVCTNLISLEYKFKTKVFELAPELEAIPSDQIYQIWGVMPQFMAVFKSLNDQNKGDILLNDLHDMLKSVESIVVPNMETAFTARKSVELAFGFDRVTKVVIEILQQYTGDISPFMMGRSEAIASNWTQAIESLANSLLSDSEKEQARMNQMLFI